VPDQQPDFAVRADEKTGRVVSVRLFGRELLDTGRPYPAEVWVNGLPLKMRLHPPPGQSEPLERSARLKGERWVDHHCGWSLVAARTMGERRNTPFRCFGIQYQLRRELCDDTDLPIPGPGGPAIEAPLHVDTFGLMNWNWRFWGGSTRMVWPSSYTGGPEGEFGHCGYEHDTPGRCKAFMRNLRRRLYPGGLVVHGGLFYDADSGNWLAITCRRPHVGYVLNVDDAGEGVGYDFTLHAPFALGDNLRMPEIKLYYGRTREEMMRWLGWYVTFYYQPPPEWVHRTVWGHGLAWNNRPTWTEQADFWEAELDKGTFSGVGYCLVTNRPVLSGTTPLGYEPDPNHGTIEEFRAACRRIAGRGVPVLIWMSHSGIAPGAHETDDDWFIRGINGEFSAGWGSRDGGMVQINPGHPGYIEYTKKWIRFYMRDCGCKGIFFDCLGWAFPPDFRPRAFMRYPGDTNLMTIRFMEEAYACIKECDPEGIMLGEGTSLDGPVNVFSIHANPVRAIDGMGPRDFFLQLNRWAPKRMVIDQGGDLFPASGFCHMDRRAGADERNRFVTKLLAERGGPGAFTHVVGDLSVLDDLLFVPVANPPGDARFARPPGTFALPAPWEKVRTLTDVLEGTRFERAGDGSFRDVPPGVYRMA